MSYLHRERPGRETPDGPLELYGLILAAKGVDVGPDGHLVHCASILGFIHSID